MVSFFLSKIPSQGEIANPTDLNWTFGCSVLAGKLITLSYLDER